MSNASWLALVAATTLGSGSQVQRVRTEVSSEEPEAAKAGQGRAGYRLVVQRYDRAALRGESFAPGANPLASTQRPVTSEQLKAGLEVDVVHVGQPAADSVVVAWVEPGEANLEFDALGARPQPGASFGFTQLDEAQASVQVVLRASGTSLAG